jgi:hypothetical protein
MDRFWDLAEERIRQAVERGEFDDLPGAGKPLDLGDDDPAWWALRKMREIAEGERLDELVRELQREIDELMLLPEESEVKRRAREIYARNVALNELLPPGKRLPPLDATEILRHWRAMYRLRQQAK